MSSFQHIQEKLEQFVKKYYVNELIRGGILFFAIGLLYFLATLLIEHYLWLSPAGRTVLFWVFVGVETALFARFILWPLAKLFKLKQGIDSYQASQIIGNHFPEVSDKLVNVLQLRQNSQQSELLLASIEQKSQELQPIPFVKAISFKKNVKYLKFAAIPVLIYLFFFLTGKKDLFSTSYERVVNYNVAYEPPAPFSFYIVNESLQTIENTPFVLQVKTAGEVVPENASIQYNGETYYLQKTGQGSFQHTFLQPSQPIEFQLQANAVTSKPYQLDVIPAPSLLSFEMQLDYPTYTQKKPETLKSTGNATVPEGTLITWKLHTKHTEEVKMEVSDTAFLFNKNIPEFSFTKKLFSK
ncbi:MAG TPA: hypothetical protein VKZ42_01420 [Flavobacteriaceae bacterium]|nr:hypothetical protein [Flavobacteriaceae bacterium]